MDLSLIRKDNLRHAYLLEGSHDELAPLLRSHLVDSGIASKSEIDTRIIPVFYIDDAHALRAAQQMTRDGKKIFIIGFDRMIEWAGHALLKVLEEPTTGTHFFFIGRSASLLLPTVVSRLLVIKSESASATRNDAAREYLAGDLYARAEALKKLIETARGDDDEEKHTARRSLIRFLDDVEREWVLIARAGRIDPKAYADGGSIIALAKRDLADPSPSIKMIFEHLALRLPRV